MTTEASNIRKPRRGIYLLPNLFTLSALFAGFYAIVAAINHRFEAAAIAVFIAMILDGLDGRVARMTNTQSDFGAEFDSLADMISFGLAPALIVYTWTLSDLGRLGWLAAFVYTAAAALRLARFNTQLAVMDKRYFKGLASPSAAAVIVGLVWFCVDWELSAEVLRIPAALLTVVAGILMVSNIPYRSFKDLNLKNRIPFVTLLIIVLVYICISLAPALVLFGIFFLYALSGPVAALLLWKRKKQNIK